MPPSEVQGDLHEYAEPGLVAEDGVAEGARGALGGGAGRESGFMVLARGPGGCMGGGVGRLAEVVAEGEGQGTPAAAAVRSPAD